MRRLICVILFAVLFCTACEADPAPRYSGDGVEITLARDDMVNGYRVAASAAASSSETASNASAPAVETVYYANINSMKFHRPSCSSARKLKQENLYLCESRERLIAEGYTPCSRCKP